VLRFTRLVFLIYLPYIWTPISLFHAIKLKDSWIACGWLHFRQLCRIALFEGGNRGFLGYCGMDVANLGECIGLCRVGITLYLVLAAFG